METPELIVQPDAVWPKVEEVDVSLSKVKTDGDIETDAGDAWEGQ
jgi:hypothetical protein